MPQYTGETASNRSLGSSGGGHGSHNGGSVGGIGGMLEGGSPNSSQLSVDGRESTLITRTQKQHVTQNVTTTTKTIREVQYLGPDGQPLDFIPGENGPYDLNHAYDNQGPAYRDMHYNMGGQYYPDYGRPPTPPTPSERSTSPTPAHWQKDFHRPAPPNSYGPPRSGYDELDTTLMPPRPGEPYRDNSSPGPASEHPGYAGYQHEMPPSNRPMTSSNQQISNQMMSSSNQMLSSNHSHHGRSSVTSSHISQHYPHDPHDDPTYGNNYDPHLNNSVFEDSGDGFHYPGGVTPLPGTLGHNTPIPREAPRAVFDDEDEQEPSPIRPMMAQRPKSSSGSGSSNQTPGMSGMPGVQWRDPDLHEVIEFLTNPNAVIKANAAAYLQHLCYMDDPVKAKTRQLGGIPPLVALLSHDIPEIHRNSCGALRNLSFGRQNDENKRAIKAAGGTNALVRLLRKTADNEVKELVTGVLWNLSSCDDLKRTIIDEALLVLINIVIIPHSGWDRGGGGGETHWSTVFRNASGILRNVSSAGDYGRKKLRECEGLVDSLLYLVRSAIERANIDNKSVENAVCVLRNLSYRSQEVEDMNYDKRQLPVGETRAGAKPNNENLGCFGASKAKGSKGGVVGGASVNSSRGVRSGGPVSGMDLLWQPEVVQPYLNLLSNCSNPETLEAAAGAIQNLAACYWQPSIDIRAAVRKEKGLPILVELLRMEVDRVVCAVATALRNLAIDQRNKELIGKYAMRDLVQKLPSGNPQRDVGTSDETIAAVLATLNEVIKKHPEFSRSLLEAGGVDRLMNITRQRAKYTSRVVKFASQVLFSMWQHQELREVYRKSGWKEADFVTKTVAARNARPNSPTNLNSTLNRPMASQGGTRYEDRTMRAAAGQAGGHHHGNNSTAQAAYHPEDVAMENLSLYGGQGGGGGAAHGAGRSYHPGPHLVRPGEPVYAQVNRDKKRSRGGGEGPGGYPGGGYEQGFNDGDYSDQHWTVNDTQGQQLDAPQPQTNAAGDSWV